MFIRAPIITIACTSRLRAHYDPQKYLCEATASNRTRQSNHTAPEHRRAGPASSTRLAKSLRAVRPCDRQKHREGSLRAQVLTHEFDSRSMPWSRDCGD